MKVMLVPPAESAASAGARQYLTSFLLNDTVALDAGSLGFYATPREQARVKHILLSHSHIDHVASLPLFVDNVYQAHADCVTFYGNEATLDSVRRDLFNDRIWPDFLRLSELQAPFLRLQLIRHGDTLDLDGLHIQVVDVDHQVPALGFIVGDAHAAAVFPCDTGPTEAIWDRANGTPHLKAVFLEAAFPNGLADLANVAKHLTPALFARELDKLHVPVDVFAVHLKPLFADEIACELFALGLPRFELCRMGAVYRF